MRLCEITIRPLGALGTPLWGDTLFGQFCWQVEYDPGLVNGGLDRWVKIYRERPFAVFSSAIMRFQDNGRIIYALKRPDLPRGWFFKKTADRVAAFLELKKIKEKPWVLVDEDGRLDLGRLAGHEELWDLLMRSVSLRQPALYRRLSKSEVQPLLLTYPQPHNTIYRLTQTTGKGAFAPYVMENYFYTPGVELALWVLIDEEALDLERLCVGLRRLGQTGFGRDASTGLGRFEVVGHRELPLPHHPEANACYTLAPCVPAPASYGEAYFVPFVRYGKHGDRLAVSRQPFKAPVVMAAQGAVFVLQDPQAFAKPWFGRAVTGVSKIQDKAVVQGYTPYLPLKLEGSHD